MLIVLPFALVAAAIIFIFLIVFIFVYIILYAAYTFLYIGKKANQGLRNG